MPEAATITELTNNVTGAVTELQNGQALLLEGIERLHKHETDPEAHGLQNADSPLRVAIDNAVKANMGDSVGKMVEEVVKENMDKVMAAPLPGALTVENGILMTDPEYTSGSVFTITNGILEVEHV